MSVTGSGSPSGAVQSQRRGLGTRLMCVRLITLSEWRVVRAGDVRPLQQAMGARLAMYLRDFIYGGQREEKLE